MNTLLKVAVVGVGNIGYHHCRNYSLMEGVKLTAIVDVDEVCAKNVAEEFHCKFYTAIEDLLENEKPDAISIAVPTSSHFAIASKCLQSGCHVLVEKPVSTNVNEIEQLMTLSILNRKILTIGHIERFNPALQKLKSLIQEGVLGEVINMVARRVGGYPPKLTDTGVYYDLAVHDLDIFHYLSGLVPDELQVQKLKVFSGKIDDSTTVFVKYPKVSGLILVNWITPVKIRQLSVTGTKGHAEVNYIDQTLSVYENNVDPDNFIEHDFIEFLHKYARPVKRDIPIEKEEPLKLELQNFVDSIKGKVELVVKPGEVIETMKIMQQYDY